MDQKDMEDVLKNKMTELENAQMEMAEMRLKIKNDRKRLVLLAQQYPAAAKAVGAPLTMEKGE